MNSSGLPEEIKERTILFRLTPEILLLDLAPSGVYLDSEKRNSQNETSDITAGAVGSYPAFSPLSRQSRDGIFSVALSVSRQSRDPGRYPALCSKVFGLSSTHAKKQ